VLCEVKTEAEETVFIIETLWGGRSRDQIPMGRDFPHPSIPALGPTSLLHNGYWVSFPGVKRLKRGVEYPPASNAEVKGRVEVYLFPASGPSSLVFG